MARSKAQQALDFVRKQAEQCESGTDLHNAFFGNGGMLGQLFPTRDEREAFWKTSEFAEIDRIRDAFDAREEAAKAEVTSPRKKRAAAKR